MVNWQNVLTFLILAVVLLIIVYRIVKYVKNPMKACNDCSSSCNDCQLFELKKEIEEKKNNKKQ